MKTEDAPHRRALPRIGVILCYCGSEIREALDFAQIEEYTRTRPGVVFVDAEPYPCSRPGIRNMVEAIKQNQLNGVVVAGCTPRLHGKLLSQICESAGLNRWLVDVVNIREHCSRVHRDRIKATEKAKALIAASVRKIGLAKPHEPVKIKPLGSVLVIGGGVSGLSAAAELINLNHQVTLIEKEDKLGGMLLQLCRPYPDPRTGKELVEDKISRIEGKVEILKQTTLSSLKGGPGEYEVTLSSDGKKEERSFGAIIVSTGAECVGLKELLEARSHVEVSSSEALKGDSSRDREFLFSQISTFGGRILMQIDLEGEPPNGNLKGASSALFVNISRPEMGHSSSRLYSLVALINAASAKAANPDLELWFVFRDIPTDFEREFRKAREAGVKFKRYSDEESLELTKQGLRLRESSGNLTEIKVELIVLPSLLKPPKGARELAELLRIPVDAHGFFIEPHIKLRPGDFVERGIFIIGSCHSPATVLECTAQAMVAASRTSHFLSGQIVKSPFISRIDEKVCRGCGRCAEACEWDAIEMAALDNGLELARVDETLCTGCGVCSTICICGAPSLGPVSQDQIRAMVEVLGG